MDSFVVPLNIFQKAWSILINGSETVLLGDDNKTTVMYLQLPLSLIDQVLIHILISPWKMCLIYLTWVGSTYD